ncbi:MAG: phosphoglucomutase/phosphomannomutase family protein, partial [Terriglobales bacterium]
MKAEIKFGTSGWRAIMADEFTVENVRRAVTGIARYVSSSKSSGARVIVGRDPRFLGETFVALAADILGEHGITPMVVSDPAPTPAIAYEVIRVKADGAINFTASHNPAEYNGVKFSGPDGAPALPEITKQIEAAVIAADSETAPSTTAKAEKVEVSIKKEYLKRLKELVDLPAIAKSGMKVAFDPLFGASRGYTDVLLREAGVDVTTVHDHRDVLFGGHPPAPDGEYLGDLTTAMKKSGARIGIACDGDADRFGVVDDDGTFISPNYVIAMLFDYIVESRGWKNGVAKSVVTTNMINALAAQLKVELYETPVGFKYIGE